MLLTRRVCLGAAVLLWAVIVYSMCGFLIIEWLDRLFGRMPGAARDQGDAFTRVFPVWELLLAAASLHMSILAYPIYSRIRRRYREHHDLCIECGRPIEDWHGRCPGCGVRLGPDPEVVVHVLRG